MRASTSIRHLRCIKLLKKIMILERIFNNFLKNKLTPMLLGGVPLGQVFCIYTCIKFHGKIPLPAFLMFLILGLDTVINNTLLFTLASRIHNESQDAIALWEKNSYKYSRKSGLKKIIRGFTPLKIRFGSNFIDRSTALVIQNEVLELTMSLLLIKN
jgi:hypothetical protein